MEWLSIFPWSDDSQSFLSTNLVQTRAKNGGNGFLWRVATVGQARAQIIDKLDEACTNGDDQMMLVQHSSGDRVMS